MAKWNTNTKHSASSINNGNRYEIQDRVTLEQLNAITENSFYASEKVDTVISDAQDVVNQGKTEIENTTSQGKNELNSIVDDAEDLVAKANTSINTVVGTANEALFTVQQVVASKGYYGSNPNILINGDFRVNQRGQKLYERTSGRVYTVDRWGIWSNNCKFDAETKTLTNLVTSGNAIMSQFIEDSEALFGKTLTLSANINNTIHTITGTVANSYDSVTSDTVIFIKEIKDMGVLVSYIRAMWDVSRQKIRIDIGCTPTGKNITIKYAKLEVGSVATSFSPRPYAEELAMCQRYYQRIRVNGVTGFVANVNVLYAGVPLIQTMRATPSVTNEVQTSVREIGKGIKGNVDLIFSALYDNILQIQADTSSLGLTLYSGCVLVNGTLVLEAEF